MRRFFIPLIIAVVAILLTALTLVQIGKQYIEVNVTPLSRLDSDFAILLNMPDHPFMMVYAINHQIPDSAKVLAFRYGEMGLYGKRHFMVAVDPALKPVYLVKTQRAAWQALHHLGVNYVFVPSSLANPLYQNSILLELLANPAYAQLVQQIGEQRLFKINTKLRISQFGPNLLRDSQFTLTADKVLKGWQVSQYGRYNQKVPGWRVLSRHRLLLSNNNWLFRLGAEKCVYTGVGALAYVPVSKTFQQRLSHTAVYQLQGKVIGKGLLTVSLMNYSRSELLGMQALWSAALLGGTHQIASQFLINPYAKDQRVVVCLRGPGRVILSPLTLRKLSVSLPAALKRKRDLVDEGYRIYERKSAGILQVMAKRINKIIFYHAGFFTSMQPVALPLWQAGSDKLSFYQPNHNHYFILFPSDKVFDLTKLHYRFGLQGSGFVEANIAGGNDLIWNGWFMHYGTYKLHSEMRELNLSISRDWFYKSERLSNAFRVALPYSSSIPAITTRAVLMLKLFPLRVQLLPFVKLTNLPQ